MKTIQEFNGRSISKVSKKKKVKKQTDEKDEVWTEQQYEEYLKGLYGMEFIAGFTEGGVPYGLFDEEESIWKVEKSDNPYEPDDELPF